MFYKNDTIALVIDGPGNNNASKDIDLMIDWRKLLGEFTRRGKVLRATFVTPMFEDSDGIISFKGLLDWLEFNGFNVVTRKAVDHGRSMKKVSIQVDFTLEALKLADHVDHIILFAGDSSYLSLIAELQRRGVRVSVCSVMEQVSDDIRRAADNFIDLNELRTVIEKTEDK